MTERSINLLGGVLVSCVFFFFSSRRRHTRLQGDWSSDVCSSDLISKKASLVRSPKVGADQGSLFRYGPASVAFLQVRHLCAAQRGSSAQSCLRDRKSVV